MKIIATIHISVGVVVRFASRVLPGLEVVEVSESAWSGAVSGEVARISVSRTRSVKGLLRLQRSE